MCCPREILPIGLWPELWTSVKELLHIWTHRVCDIVHKTWESLSQTKWQRGKGRSVWNLTSSYGAIDNWELLGKGQSVFFKDVALAGLTRLQWILHNQEHMDSRNWNWCFFFNVFLKKWTQSWVSREGGVDLGGLEGRGDNNQTMLYKIIKELITWEKQWTNEHLKHQKLSSV